MPFKLNTYIFQQICKTIDKIALALSTIDYSWPEGANLYTRFK